MEAQNNTEIKHAEFLAQMPNTAVLDLAFSSGDGTALNPAMAWLVVKSPSQSPDGLTTISPLAVTPSELNRYIDDRIKELEAIKSQAQKLFEKADKDFMK